MVFIVAAGGLLAILGSISASAIRNSPSLSPISRLNAPTPTPVPTPASVPGSTDGIMLMGVIIALVILLPILLNKNTWTKS